MTSRLIVASSPPLRNRATDTLLRTPTPQWRRPGPADACETCRKGRPFAAPDIPRITAAPARSSRLHGPGLLALHVPDRSSYREHCFDLMTGPEENAAQVAEDNILTSYHGVAESGGGKCARIG